MIVGRFVVQEELESLTYREVCPRIGNVQFVQDVQDVQKPFLYIYIIMKAHLAYSFIVRIYVFLVKYVQKYLGITFIACNMCNLFNFISWSECISSGFKLSTLVPCISCKMFIFLKRLLQIIAVCFVKYVQRLKPIRERCRDMYF